MARGLTALAGTEIVTGDVRDDDSLLAAVRGCDTVFHLAALMPRHTLDSGLQAVTWLPRNLHRNKPDWYNV